MMDNKFKITRRSLLGNIIGLASVSSIPLIFRHYTKAKPPIVNVYRPGMAMGHAMRDFTQMPEPAATWHCDLMILGSGAAGLAAAWKLKKEGKTNFILLNGPEANGNNAGIDNKELHYPTSAHYIALPSMESFHLREMLSDIGVLIGDPYVEVPEYDEMVVVHAPEERVLYNGTWQSGLLPELDKDSVRFFELIKDLTTARGTDGKKIFAIPITESSSDEKWRLIDKLTFSDWLTQNNYSSKPLRWYLNYCCRDDYGQGIEKVSAWAGLHYFCSRNGKGKNIENGAVLTWQDGLATFSNKLRESVGFQHSSILAPNENAQQPQVMNATVLKIIEHKDKVELLIGGMIEKQFKTVKIFANKVISAMPLHMLSYLIDDLEPYGYASYEDQPISAPWMVSNFVLRKFPKENDKGAELSWDNVTYEGKGLGYVVSTHQLIRVAKPERTAFTAYLPLDHDEPSVIRSWLQDAATEEELVTMAAQDLLLSYGENFWSNVEQIDITLRGHAMAVPTPGYLSSSGRKALQNYNGRIVFAHSDLSSYSVIEEATWWGYQAALKCLG